MPPRRATTLPLQAPTLALAGVLYRHGTPRETAITLAAAAAACALAQLAFPAKRTTTKAPTLAGLFALLPVTLRPEKAPLAKTGILVESLPVPLKNELGTALAALLKEATGVAAARKDSFLSGSLARLPGDLYETLLHTPLTSSREEQAIERAGIRDHRLASGSFYTPAPIIAELTALAELTPEHRVCDPAMGCGPFLIGALDALQPQLTPDALCQWAAENLYGCDLNPSAVWIARLCLWLRLSRKDQPFLPSARHFFAADSLLLRKVASSRSTGGPRQTDAAPRIRFPVFDRILGNPPYDVLTNFHNRPQNARYAATLREMALYPHSMHGQINLYRCFIERGLQMLRPGGRLCFIVPATLAADRVAEALRKDLLTRHAADHFRFLAENDPAFPGICQATLLFRTTKDGGAAPHITFRRGSDCSTLTQEELAALEFRIPDLSGNSLALLRWLREHCQTTFGSLVSARVGEVDQTFAKAFICGQPSGALLVRGSHITAFHVDVNDEPAPGRYLDAAGFRKFCGTKWRLIAPLLQQVRVVQMGIRNLACRPRLLAALLPAGVFCGNSVNVYLPAPGWSPELVAGLLSSALYDQLFRLRSTNNNINLHEMLTLPFPADLSPNAAGVKKIERAFVACAAHAATHAAVSTPTATVRKATALRKKLDDAVNDLFALPAEFRSLS